MNLIYYFFLFLLLPMLGFGRHPCYTLSICAIFKNEAPYLREWIEFHRLVGVEHFFLYNNESTDEFANILAPYVNQHIVEVFDWPNKESEPLWIQAQTRAYNHCIKRSTALTEWLALIDIDEFMVPVNQSNLIDFLSQFKKRSWIGAIQMNWQLYGTSHLWEIPENHLLIESLILKAPSYYTAIVGLDHTRFKSIVRPEAVKHYEVHFGTYKSKYKIFPKEPGIQIDEIRLNHYWSRNEKFFHETKIDRRLQFGFLTRGELIEKLFDLNQVEDQIMLRFIPQLKERLSLNQSNPYSVQ